MELEKLKPFLSKFSKWSFEITEDTLHVNNLDHQSIDALFEVLQEILTLVSVPVSINVSFGDIPQATLEISKNRTPYKRMYTSGCFDIFHYGHLNILKRSKEMCDFLIVGVSTDELIEKEKGKRPVIPFEERFRVIQSIRYVDQVIPQVDKNKQQIVDQYNIDAISVGDDWKGRFPKTTCHVEYLPYTKSVSSTILKNTLQILKKD